MANIVEIASRFTKLKKSGNIYTGLCPLHGDKVTPSFCIYPHSNSWVCFGKCQSKNGGRNGGDVAELVMQYFNYSYPEALEYLGEEPEDNEPVISFNVKKQPKILPDEIVYYWHSLLGDKEKFFINRGFTQETIYREFWGFDGNNRVTIPIWDWEPGRSDIIGVRKRLITDVNEPKYIGYKNFNSVCLWGKWYCQNSQTIFAFAGELDAALAVQDGLPSFSVVNGINSIYSLPDGWPNVWFPKADNLIVIFDKKEESNAGQLAAIWNSSKTAMSAKVFHWPFDSSYKDYGEFRQHNSFNDFMNLLATRFPN